MSVTPTVSGLTSDVRAAQNSAGASVAVWIDAGGKSAQASFRPAGGSAWFAPTTLPGMATLGTDRVGLISIFDVDLADDGSAVVAMSLSQGGQHGVVVWRYTPDGAWGTPIVMASAVDPGATAVSIDRDGFSTAAWQRSEINVARLAPDASSATLTHRSVPNLTDNYAQQRFAIGPGGAVTAVVFGSSHPGRSGLLGYRLPAGASTWQGPASIIPPGQSSPGSVDLVANNAGAALVVWQQRVRVANQRPRSSSLRSTLFARRMTPAGRWGAAKKLSSSPKPDRLYRSISATLGESGVGAVVFLEDATQGLLASVSNGTSWKPPHLITRKAI